MSEEQKLMPEVSFNVWPFSVAFWKKPKDNGGFRKWVSVQKSSYNAEDQREDQRLSLNLSEVSCLAGLLGKMQDAVITERGQEDAPF